MSNAPAPVSQALDINYAMLYVDNPPASASFYAGLLGRQPIEVSPTFALFAMASGLMFGLWSKHSVEPKASGAIGGAEIAIKVASSVAVRATHADWVTRGLTIAQAPTAMDFGTTFVALDPDGHRLRVFATAD
ncbi:MAG: drug:proton antiporter [Rhodopseudomonas sp.]|nr:drug:proton antiporter [Rhodopseudomonas sp.]